MLAAALWATLGIASRGVLAAGVTPLELAFWRAALGGLLFAAQAARAHRLRVEPADRAGVAAFAVVGVSVFYLSYLFAVRDGGATLAAILLYTAPAWVALASALFLRVRITRRAIGAIGLTLAGVCLVAWGAGSAPGLRLAPAGIAWGLCAGFAYASYYLFGARYFTRYQPATLFMYALPLGALIVLPAVQFAPKDAATWGAIVFVAVVPTWIALQVYGAGLRRLDATRAVTVATLEPVIAALLAYIVWGEALGPMAYAGGVLVLLGVLLTASVQDVGQAPQSKG